MQEREFDKLMDGQPAKWAELINPQSNVMELRDQLQTNVERKIKLTLIPGESKASQRAKIKEAEKPIPNHISDAIHKYVMEERKKKVSERAIRRAVKRKWNIYVV